MGVNGELQMSVFCVIFMGVLPYIWVGFAKFGGKDGFDNNNPRGALATLSGWRSRANFAQANQFEAFPLFAAAVLFALYHHAPEHPLNLLCLAVVALRVIYGFLYMADKASLRSLVWFISLLCTISLFFI